MAANWKMNKGPSETEDFLNNLVSKIGKATDKCDVVVAPPFISLPAASQVLSSHDVSLSAQNVSQYDAGAYTAEVSVMMLKELHIPYVILGHSERRSLFGESDAIINAKMHKAREANLRPIFCIGETLEEREAGQLEAILRRQITEGLKGLSEKDVLETVIAYEPVWAIGTGVTASPEQAQQSHAQARAILAETFSADIANNCVKFDPIPYASFLYAALNIIKQYGTWRIRRNWLSKMLLKGIVGKFETFFWSI